MNKFKWFSASAAFAAAAVVSLPAAAQTNVYNYGSGCAPSTNAASISCTPAAGYGLTTSGWSATSGGSYVAATLTNQGTAGIGLASGATGDPTAAPDHGVDNNVYSEVVLLNFGTNRVVVNGLAIGWYSGDSDLALYRWNGAATGPVMTGISNTTNAAGLISAGWVLAADRDLDNNSTQQGADVAGRVNWQYTNASNALVNGTGLATTAANASSWWLVAAYVGGGTQVADTQKDYFKLLEISAACVSNTSGGACGTTTSQTPEPASLALVGVALAGALHSTRRRKKAA